MPPLALVMAGAGLCAGFFAGYKWLSREVKKQAAQAARVNEDLRRRAAGMGRAPRDLGRLEWDATAGVYRPADGV